MLTRVAKLKSWPQFDPPLQQKSIKKFNNEIGTEPDIYHEKRTEQSFQEKIFNGHNGYSYLAEPIERHYVTTPTLPSYHGPDDYRFNPALPKSNIQVSTHGEPSHREYGHNVEENTFKREASFYDNKYFADAESNINYWDDGEEIADSTEEANAYKREAHFAGFGENSILSQVGKGLYNPAYTKSHLSSPQIPSNSQLDLTEPLFYPRKRLTPPPHHDRSSNLGAPSSQFHETQSFKATPLPPRQPPTHSPFTPRPTPTFSPPSAYFSKPLSYSSPHNEYSPQDFSPTPSPSHFNFSPTPYVGYGQFSSESDFYQLPTSSPALNRIQHISNNFLGNVVYFKLHQTLKHER